MKTIAINDWPSLNPPPLRSNHDYFFSFFWTLPLVVSISIVGNQNRKLFCNFIWCRETCLAYITRKSVNKYSPIVDCYFCFNSVFDTSYPAVYGYPIENLTLPSFFLWKVDAFWLLFDPKKIYFRGLMSWFSWSKELNNQALLNPHWLKIKLNKVCSFLQPMRNLKLSSGTWLAFKIKTIILMQQIRRLNEIVHCYLSILIFKIQSLNNCLLELILSLVSLISF